MTAKRISNAISRRERGLTPHMTEQHILDTVAILDHWFALTKTVNWQEKLKLVWRDILLQDYHVRRKECFRFELRKHFEGIGMGAILKFLVMSVVVRVQFEDQTHYQWVCNKSAHKWVGSV